MPAPPMGDNQLPNKPFSVAGIKAANLTSVTRWINDTAQKLTQWWQVGTNRLQGIFLPAPTPANDLEVLQYSASTNQFGYAPLPTPTTVPDASDTVIGITKLSVAPASALNPIALGVNDPDVIKTTTALGGDLDGTLPDATLAVIGPAAGPVGDSTHVAATSIDDKGRVVGLTPVAIAFPPSFSAPGPGLLWTPASGPVLRAVREYAGIRMSSPSSNWATGGANTYYVGACAIGSGGSSWTDGTARDATRVLLNFVTGGSSGDATHSFNGVSPQNASVPTYGYGVILSGYVQLVTTATVRVWCGLVDSGADGITLQGADNSSTISYALLRFSTSASDTHWQACTGDGSGHHETATTEATTSGNTVSWSIDTTPGSSIIFTLNGVSTTVSTNIPGSTRVALPWFSITTLANSAATVAYGEWSQLVRP